MNILTSSNDILSVEVRSQQPRTGDKGLSVNLKLSLKQILGKEVFKEQQTYLEFAAQAAYVSLNPLDRKRTFKASVLINSMTNDSFHLASGSSSSGLGFSLAIFESFWTEQLGKKQREKVPVFASGEVTNIGAIRAVGFIPEKISSLISHIERSEYKKFIVVLPEQNKSEVSKAQLQKIESLYGHVIFAKRVQDVLLKLFLNDYDGEVLGRWKPFKGLNSFDFEDSNRFFGRDEDVKRLVQDIKRNEGILIVSGQTGSGKTSIIQAGLIPYLCAENRDLYWKIYRPTKLNESLFQTVLKDALSELIESTVLIDKRESFVAKADDIVNELSECIDVNGREYLFYVDQFEEFFTHSHLLNFLENFSLLHQLAKCTKKVKVVISIRNDYLGQFLESNLVASPIISNVSEKLSVQSWNEIIFKQAHFSGIEFETYPNNLGLRLIEDAMATPNALPMVEYILDQLFEASLNRQANDIVLLNDDYDKLGTITGVIAKRADDAITTSNVSSKTISGFFSLFVGKTQNNLLYPKKVSQAEINSFKNSDELNRLIDNLRLNNIIVLQQNEHGQVFSLVHDCLFTHWDKLSKWHIEQRDYLKWRNSIDLHLERWLEASSSNQHLLNDARLLREGVEFKKRGALVEDELLRFIEKSRQAKRNKILQKFFVFGFLPLLSIFLIYWDSQQFREEYFINYSTKWSVPVGVGKISRAQISSRQSHFKFIYEGGQLSKILGIKGNLVEMRHENSQGSMIETKDEWLSPKLAFSYSDDGKLQRVVFKDEHGQFIKQHYYQFNDNKAFVHIQNQDFFSISHQVDLKEIDSSLYQSSLVTRLEKIYSENGLLLEYYNQKDGYGQRITDDLKSFGRRYEYTETGLKLSESFINQDGDESSAINGIARRTFSYSKIGELISSRTHRQNGELIFNSMGIKGTRYIYDENGNLSRIDYHDENNILTPSNAGISSVRFFYDRFGNLKEESFLDNNGQPVSSIDGYAKVRYEYDDNGRETLKSFFNADNELIPDVTGSAITRTSYNENGQVILISFYNSKDEPIMLSLGHSKERYIWEGDKNTRIEYLDEDGDFVVGEEGFAIEQYEYDSKGRQINIQYLDENQNLVNTKQGYAIEVYTYNPKGLITHFSYLDSSNNKTLNKEGCHQEQYEFDDAGSLKSLNCLGLDGMPLNGIRGYAAERYEYDEFGSPIRVVFYDENNQIAALSSGESGWESKYDETGRELSITYLDNELNPTWHKNGYVSVHYEYDSDGNNIIESFHGMNKELVLNNEGFAFMQSSFNDRRYEIERLHYDVNGELTLTADGIAGWQNEYDNKGNEVKRIYLGKNRQPTLTADGSAGWISIFDSYNNELKRTYVDTEGTPTFNDHGYVSWISTYDSYKNELSTFFLDKDDLKTNAYGGYAGYISEYDQRKNQTSIVYLDVNGKPTLMSDGYASWNKYYDAAGNVTQKLFYGSDGERIILEDGYSGWKSAYDSKANEIERIYLNNVNQPIVIWGGFAGWKSKYNNIGQEIETTFLGIDGKIKTTISGEAGYKIQRDNLGNVIGQMYFGLEGGLVNTSGEYAGWESTFDKFGNETSRQFYDEEQELTLIDDGYASWHAEFDRYGNEVKVRFFGLNKEPIKSSDGQYGWVSEYNKYGQEISTFNIGPDGNIILNDEGVAGSINRFDIYGNEIGKIFVDLNGQPLSTDGGFTGGISNFDQYGNEVKRTFVDSSGLPTLISEGYVSRIMEYDSRGNEIKRVYLDMNDNPVIFADGFAIGRSYYDSNGNVIKRLYFDANDDLIIRDGGYAGWKAEFDNKGNEIQITYLGKDGKPVVNDDGYAISRTNYDADGKELETIYYDEKGLQIKIN